MQKKEQDLLYKVRFADEVVSLLKLIMKGEIDDYLVAAENMHAWKLESIFKEIGEELSVNYGLSEFDLTEYDWVASFDI